MISGPPVPYGLTQSSRSNERSLRVLPASLDIQDSHTSSSAQRTHTTPQVGGSGQNTSRDALSTSSATLPMHRHMIPGAERGHTSAQRQCGEECSGVTRRHRGPTDKRLVRQSPARTHISRLTRLPSMASAAGGRSLDPSSSQIPDPNVKSQSQKQSFGRKPQIPKERTGGWELVKPLGSDQIPTSLRVSQNRNRKV